MIIKNRRIFTINPYERKMLLVVFFSASVPIVLVVGFFYSVFSDLLYTYMNSGLAGQFLRQFSIDSVIILVYYFLIVGIIAYRFIHKLVGPFPRILKELDEKIAGKSRSLIYLRQGDYAKELVSRLNALIEKLPK